MTKDYLEGKIEGLKIAMELMETHDAWFTNKTCEAIDARIVELEKQIEANSGEV